MSIVEQCVGVGEGGDIWSVGACVLATVSSGAETGKTTMTN
ncbi:MAG: hypothetical protein WC028_14295 [Candidatus Obscuribacterales bacterium]